MPELPPVLLLSGPDAAVLERQARDLVHRAGVHRANLIVRRTLPAAVARELVRAAAFNPLGELRAIIICLDGASEQAQHILLKTLEEPPERTRFILVATVMPLPTIVSRCQVLSVPAARQSREPDGKAAAQVNAALMAATAGDPGALDAAMAGWGDAHQACLEARLAETAVSGAGAERSRAWSLLNALGRLSGAHPRLAAHAALAAIYPIGVTRD